MNRRRNTPLLLSILMGLMIIGACSNNLWDELPTPVARFIAEYFPGSGIKSYNVTDDGNYRVKIDNSVTLTFDSACNWTCVDGNGGTLPPVFIQDQLPPALLRYLQETEDTDNVYLVVRNGIYYKVTLVDTVLTYEIETGTITYPDGTSHETEKSPLRPVHFHQDQR